MIIDVVKKLVRRFRKPALEIDAAVRDGCLEIWKVVCRRCGYVFTAYANDKGEPYLIVDGQLEKENVGTILTCADEPVIECPRCHARVKVTIYEGYTVS